MYNLGQNIMCNMYDRYKCCISNSVLRILFQIFHILSGFTEMMTGNRQQLVFPVHFKLNNVPQKFSE